MKRVERASLSQRMVPLCSRTMAWAMDSPRPKPPWVRLPSAR